jgi:hypothetical protein
MVSDGADVWLTAPSAWEDRRNDLENLAPYATDDGAALAYDAMCDRISPCVSMLGGARGADPAALVEAAVAAGLIDADSQLVREHGGWRVTSSALDSAEVLGDAYERRYASRAAAEAAVAELEALRDADVAEGDDQLTDIAYRVEAA